MRVTSPGILLILAVVAAGGIFLLDVFYLRPYAESHKWAALREQAVRAENAARLALKDEEENLLSSTAAWGRSRQVQSYLRDRTSPDEVDAFIREALGCANAEVVWLSDSNGVVLRAWSRASEAPGESAAYPAYQEANAVVAAAGGPGWDPSRRPAGLLTVPGKAVLFARQEIADDGEPSATLGGLWAVRRLGQDILARIDATIGGDLVLVAGPVPNGDGVHGADGKSMWMVDENVLAVAWPVSDAAGRDIGHFRADLSVGQVHAQAVASRRMALIILSLSVGLTMLVIVGAHILVTGPVVRLLRRLQQIEAGEATITKDLFRDLHGEPLMLARRLESAFDRLTHMTKTDQLTGLANRRHFEEVLEAFYHQARRYNRPLSLMVLDVDFFKAINDTGGHQAGDELLKIVAVETEKACRKADLPARFGGDEFAVLLPETAAHEAANVAERLRQEICRRQISVGGLQLNVTISVGITDLNAGEMDSPEAMLTLGDRALYSAKEQGRNRIVQAHDLNGVGFKSGEHTRKVDTLCKKLAGLDNQFKDVFLKGVEEIVVILEQRDQYMADHARKVRRYATLISREMGLPDRAIQRIQIAAMLHDIGMLAMPDAILLCPSELTDEQMLLMRKHTLMGVRIMEGMEFLEQEIPAVRYHHERWDGKGYPEGLAGGAIPLTARILAVADAFDAMTSPRTFRSAKTRAEAVEEVRLSAGRQFDPAVVEAFLAVAGKMGDELVAGTSEQAETTQEEPQPVAVAPTTSPDAQPNVDATWRP